MTGNATLFEGATVETRFVVSTLDLSSGTHIALWPESKGRVFGDHLTLEKGAGEMGRTAGFRMEARSLRIQPETGQASARVTLAGTTHVQVAALTGSLRVLNSRGLLIAALAPGTALDFDPPATPQAGGELWKMTGCLRVATGHFLLTDETYTNVTAGAGGRSVGCGERQPGGDHGRHGPYRHASLGGDPGASRQSGAACGEGLLG